MGRNLVIVESPAKAKSIGKVLGKDYQVLACYGHVRDLPDKGLGVDIDKGFEPTYVTHKKKIRGKDPIAEIRKAAKEADAIILAPDPDREGEAIAWHLEEILKRKGDPGDRFQRVTYNEITPRAVKAAFGRPGRIDLAKVSAQEARRILDRIVGFDTSRLLWRAVKGGRGAGRVFTVALRLVCEREAEIEAFTPEEYWILGAEVRKQVDPRDPFPVRLSRIDGEKAEIRGAEAAQAVRGDLDGRALRVTSVTTRDTRRRPRPPFITSTLQQAANSLFGMTPTRAMQVAQRLYEAGHITYMRTDSPALSQDAVAACRREIESRFGREYLPESAPAYAGRSGAQEAHEAIRPTDFARDPASLDLSADEAKVYRAIWERTLACQMTPAVISVRQVEVEAVPPRPDARTFLFRASASEVKFPGYLKVAGAGEAPKASEKDAEEGATDQLPPLAEGETLDVLNWLEEQKFTQPPPRYSEATLVRALEENGVGRPSTYAPTVAKLVDQEYAAREKRTLRPTDLGRQVHAWCVSHFPDLFKAEFTAEMERQLDRVEAGELERLAMLTAFYDRYKGWLGQAQEARNADPDEVGELLRLLEAVETWTPSSTRGKRTYDDRKFVEEIRAQAEAGEKEVTENQLAQLKRLAARYRAQIPDFDAAASRLGLAPFVEQAKKNEKPPRETTPRKLELLGKVSFDPPRQVGRRTYDDKAFFESLRSQVAGGRRLSEKQLLYLDRLVQKYAEQIPEFEAERETLGVEAPAAEREALAPLVEMIGHIREFNPPVTRGKRTFDDREFLSSIARQFKERSSLSDRQVAALKKALSSYASQIPDYVARREELGLPPARVARKPKKAAAGSPADAPAE